MNKPWNKKLDPVDVYNMRAMRRRKTQVKVIADRFSVSMNLVSRYTRDLSGRKVRNDKGLRNNEKKHEIGLDKSNNRI